MEERITRQQQRDADKHLEIACVLAGDDLAGNDQAESDEEGEIDDRLDAFADREI
jgi:hypothetical protein